MKLNPLDWFTSNRTKAEVEAMGFSIERSKQNLDAVSRTLEKMHAENAAEQLKWENLSAAFQRDLPSITQQTSWPCGIFNFGKAEIPGVRYFNSGLIEAMGKRFLLARRCRDALQGQFGFNDIMAFELNGTRPVQGVKVKLESNSPEEQFEDPRIISAGNHLLLATCNFILRGQAWTGAHQTLHVLNGQWSAVRRYDPVYGKNGDGIRTGTGNEKNWLWFFHGEDLHLVYLTRPHQVVNFGNAMIPGQEYITPLPLNAWKLGEPRGGTPPVRVANEYWSFFHASTPWVGKFRRYYMGAYAFQAEAPFQVTRMTPEPLLAGSKNDLWFEGKPLVVFPCGAILKDEKWLVTGGSNDLQSFWIEIPHADLLELAKPIV